MKKSWRALHVRNSFQSAMLLGCQPPVRRCFATTPEVESNPYINIESKDKRKKISSKVLCDITGTRYYQHNEEIIYPASKVIRLFDENNVNLGDMLFGEAYNLAKDLEKDIVLRNTKTDPPVCKIMNYRLELLKRLFKKLGKEINQKDKKAKQVTLTTTINMHDLENKKRRSIEMLKNFTTLKFFMKVNVYD